MTDSPRLWPTTPLQQGLVALAQLHGPESYLGHAVVHLGGEVDADLLGRAIAAVLTEQPQLHASFLVAPDVDPVQVVEDGLPGDIVTHGSQADPAAVLQSRAREDWSLDVPPLVRFDLLPASRTLLVTAHHAVLDGWSMPVLVDEIARHCGLLADGASPVPAARGRYEAHLAHLGSLDREGARAFWAAHLADLDRARPGWLEPDPGDGAPHTERTLERRVRLPQELSAHGLTPAALARTCWDLALDAVGGTDASPFAMAVSTRDGGVEHVDEVIGLTTDAVLVAEHADPAATVLELVRLGAARWAQTVPHQHVGLRGIHAALGGGELARSILAVEPARAATVRPAGPMTLTLGEVDDRTHYPLAATLRADHDGWVLQVRHDERVRPATAARLAHAFVALAEHPDIPLATIDLLGEDDTALLVHAQGDRPLPEPEPRTLPQALAAACTRHPERVALVGAGAAGRTSAWTFAELSARIERTSRELLAALPATAPSTERGATCGPVVAVVAPRSAAVVVALLAALDIGATAAVIDPALPSERLEQVLEDLDVAVVVGGQQADELSVRHTAPRGADRRRPRPEDVAVITLTSGSTGRPKPVATPHRALAHLLDHHLHELHPVERPRPVAHTASFFFDAQWDALLALFGGHPVHVLDEDLYLDPFALADYTAAEQIDYLDLTPTVWSALLAADAFTRMPATCVLGGEALPASLWTQLRTRTRDGAVRALNLYGPTEATVDAAWADVADTATPVVGRAVAGTGLLVLDAYLRPVPPGTTGELYLTGPGLAHGYLGQPARTAERFVANPHPRRDAQGRVRPGDERLYRTGDLAHWDDAGLLVLEGRADEQLSLGGRRVEPGEIEAVLLTDPAVAQAAVAVQDSASGRGRLVAHVVPAPGSAPEPEELIARCRAQLAAALVPAQVVIRSGLPLTANGKLDRRALTAARSDRSSDDGLTTSPASAQVEPPALAAARAVYAGVLRVDPDQLSPDADLFALGGDSISAIQICAGLRARGWAVAAARVLADRTPRLVAAAAEPVTSPEAPTVAVELTAAQRERAAEHLARVRPGARLESVLPLSPTQLGLYVDTQRHPRDPYVTTMTLRLDDPTGCLDEALVDQAVGGWFERHESLRVVVWQGDLPVPVALVADRASLPHEVVDARGADVQAALAAAQEAEGQRPLDVHAGALAGYTWVRADDESSWLVVSLHHLVADGWSTPLLVEELGEQLAGAEITGVDRGFRDYLTWWSQQDHARLEQVWRDELAGRAPSLLAHPGSPGDGPVRADARLAGAEVGTATAHLAARGLTLAAACQAAWAHVVAAATGGPDTTYLLVSAGRPGQVPAVDRAVGMFVTTRPVPADTTLTPDELMHAITASVARTEDAAHLGLGAVTRLVGELADSLLVIESYPRPRSMPGGGPRVTPVEGHDATTFPVAATVMLAGPGGAGGVDDGLVLEVEVDPQRTSVQATTLVHGWAQALRALLDGRRPELTTIGRVTDAEVQPDEHPARPVHPETTATGSVGIVVRTVAQVLGIDVPDAEESFFALGGDSIAAVQLVGALRSEGLRVGIGEIFSAGALTDIAARAVPVTPDAGGTRTDGTRPEWTPALAWFRDLRAPDHGRGFVQLRAVSLPAGTRVTTIGAAVQALVERHEALRLALHDDGPSVTAPRPAVLSVVGADELVPELRRLGRELDPTAGDLVRAVVVPADDAVLVVLLVHHIGVDAVSWGLIEDELVRLVEGRVPPAAPSFSAWTRAQHQAVPLARRSLDHWERALASAEPLLTDTRQSPAGNDGTELGTVGAARTTQVVLPVEVTARLLQHIRAGWRPEALLVAALTAARDGDLVVELEGHGRPTGLAVDDPRAGTAAAGAVGWFTATWPVRAPGRRGANAVGHVHATAVAVDQARDHGADYGLLRHLDPVEGPRLAAAERGTPPQVLVNYLGAAGGAHDGIDAAALEEQLGLHDDLPVSHPVELNAHLDETGEHPVLVARWQLARPFAAAADALLTTWTAAVTALADLDLGAPPAQLFDGAGLRADELAGLAADADIEAVWEPTPVQRGMVVHAAELEDPYTSVLELAVDGELAAELVREAVIRVLDAHPQLRLRVRWVGHGSERRPVLVTVRGGDCAWREVDLRDHPDAESQVRRVVEDELAHRYDLEREPLLRATWVRLAPTSSRLVLANHHLLLDGWSMPLLVDAVLQAAVDIRAGRAAEPVACADSAHARHEARRQPDAVQAAATRRGALLAGVHPGAVTDIPGAAGPAAQQAVEIELDADGVRAAARRLGTTPAVVLALAWCSVLAARTGCEDVVTATVTSGRAPGTDDAELIGMLTDTMPLVARLGQGTVAEAARALAEQTAAALGEPVVGSAAPFSGLARRLEPDSLLVVENYPATGPDALARTLGVRVDVLGGADATHYPLSLTVETGGGIPGPGEGEALRLRLEHDPASVPDDAAHGLVRGLRAVLAGLVSGEREGAPEAPAAGLCAVARRHVPAAHREPEGSTTPAEVDPRRLEDVLDAYAEVFPSLARQPADAGPGTLHAESNFFALGGDSILAMTLVTACRRRGLTVRPSDVLGAPTPLGLAARAVAAPAAPPGPTTARPAIPAAPLVTLDASGSAALDDLLRSLQ